MSIAPTHPTRLLTRLGRKKVRACLEGLLAQTGTLYWPEFEVERMIIRLESESHTVIIPLVPGIDYAR